MRKSTIKIILCVSTLTFIISIAFTSNFLLINSAAFEEEFEPEYGPAPEIDGELDSFALEWDNATKEDIEIDDLPVEVWVMQNSSNLYIALQLELEYLENDAFIGIFISKSSDDEDDDFVDAKFIQFSKLSEKDQDYEYLDYHIEKGDEFKEDEDEEGEGAADLEDDEIICEFSIPVNNSETVNEDEDVLLDMGEEYAFKIVYGEGGDYDDDIIKSDTVLISIEYPPKPPEPEIWEIVLFVLAIIAFVTIGVFYGFYIYKIFRLKGKVKRIKR